MTLGRSCALVALCGLVACAGVLGLSRPGQGAFPHRRHVIAGVSCTRCHAAVGDGSPALHLPDDATCTSCHKKPHDPRPCLTCHVAPGALAALTEAKDHLNFDHRRHEDATRGNCMRCHTGIADGDDHLRPVMANCFGCHASDARRDARACSACHKNLAEEGSLPASHLAHDGDWLREHGTRAASSGDVCASCHQASFCASCHGVTVPALPATRRFADPFAASVHRAGFAARHSLEARSAPGACTTCHAPARCIACHTERGIAESVRGSPHPVGWVGITASSNLHGREARRDPASCAGCHGGAGERLCVTCHAVGGVGGNPHPPGWSSSRPLSALPCRLCHPAGTR